MNDIIKKVEEIVEREVENDLLKSEISELKKMLKTGFEAKTDGYDRIPKLMSTADEKKLAKFYDNFGNQIKALKMTGDLDKFVQYLEINHGINITVKDDFPNIQFAKNDKKKQKFYDIYSTYFLEDVPKDPKTALDKITKSLYNIFKEYKKEEEPIKEDLKTLIENEEYSSAVIMTLNKIIKKAKVKEEKIEDIAGEVEIKLNEQLKAVEIIEG